MNWLLRAAHTLNDNQSTPAIVISIHVFFFRTAFRTHSIASGIISYLPWDVRWTNNTNVSAFLYRSFYQKWKWSQQILSISINIRDCFVFFFGLAAAFAWANGCFYKWAILFVFCLKVFMTTINDVWIDNMYACVENFLWQWPTYQW